jgi:4a-hydroxytetrahydrobiopterin dehydratase
MVKAFSGPEVVEALRRTPEWRVKDNHDISRQFSFPDFKSALDFVNQVGAAAEALDHHPEILLTWGKVQVTVWTHSVDGLSSLDFELAGQIDSIFEQESRRS